MNFDVGTYTYFKNRSLLTDFKNSKFVYFINLNADTIFILESERCICTYDNEQRLRKGEWLTIAENDYRKNYYGDRILYYYEPQTVVPMVIPIFNFTKKAEIYPKSYLYIQEPKSQYVIGYDQETAFYIYGKGDLMKCLYLKSLENYLLENKGLCTTSGIDLLEDLFGLTIDWKAKDDLKRVILGKEKFIANTANLKAFYGAFKKKTGKIEPILKEIESKNALAKVECLLSTIINTGNIPTDKVAITVTPDIHLDGVNRITACDGILSLFVNNSFRESDAEYVFNDIPYFIIKGE